MVLAIISDSQNVFLQFSKMGIINSFCAEFISFCANMKYLNKKSSVSNIDSGKKNYSTN